MNSDRKLGVVAVLAVVASLMALQAPPALAVPYTLTVSKTGTGSGTVTSSPAGINCGADCSETYEEGTSVTLTATPSTGSSFAGWSGAGCSGTGTCTVLVSADTTVTATFKVQHTVSIVKAGEGDGAVTSSPPGINCGTDCSEPFDPGTTVTLTPTPSAGSYFAGWFGGCGGRGSCTVVVQADTTAEANFFPISSKSVRLTASDKLLEGGGRVTLIATLQPCNLDNQVDLVIFKGRGRAERLAQAQCKAKYRPLIRNTTRFRAISPADYDSYGDTSNSVLVRVRTEPKPEPSGGGGGGGGCDPSYPDFCIPPPPPDLDCAQVGGSNFTVVGSDPHGFDGDNDGVGCET